MNIVKVSASHDYDVKIGRGLLSTLGTEAAALCRGKTACIVSDDTVAALYAKPARASLEAAGFAVCTYIFPHGEESKNGETFLKLLSFLAANHLTRADLLVALGGGVTGDLTGFAASCYLRGIAYIQVPTTLLAMVDSSVGGKTAIDLPEGKNLCGAFYQPSLVLCDIDTLNTLPQNVFRDGCAEVIKYGVLGSRPLFDALKGDFDMEAVVTQCVMMKKALVEEDEFDQGNRQLLNLGHTLGHAIEANSNFTLSHGQCVAIGMAQICQAAAKHGLCQKETCEEIISLLETFGLPTKTSQSKDSIYQTALGDKKRRSNTLTLIVPTEVGNCILHPIPVEELSDWI